MIMYLGSKKLLLPLLEDVVSTISPNGGVVADLFSGSCRVGHALKKKGYKVLSNDHNTYAATLGKCYVQSDLGDHQKSATSLIRELNGLPGSPGYFTETFCQKSRFFQPKNGERIDAIRESIAKKGLDPELESILLTSLMEAANKVDSTVGLQMAYLKKWSSRSFKDLELQMPEVLPQASSGKGESYQLDAVDASQKLSSDIAYLDPPYNSHKYLGNYHIWESLVLWDKPEVYGVACKRVDCQTRKSPFNYKESAKKALEDIFSNLRAPHIVVSFNNEGFFTSEDMTTMLSKKKYVYVIEKEHRRHKGAEIGIHNLKGEKVGEVSHLKNIEYTYVATSDDSVAERLKNRNTSESLLFSS